MSVDILDSRRFPGYLIAVGEPVDGSETDGKTHYVLDEDLARHQKFRRAVEGFPLGADMNEPADIPVLAHVVEIEVPRKNGVAALVGNRKALAFSLYIPKDADSARTAAGPHETRRDLFNRLAQNRIAFKAIERILDNRDSEGIRNRPN